MGSELGDNVRLMAGRRQALRPLPAADVGGRRARHFRRPNADGTPHCTANRADDLRANDVRRLLGREVPERGSSRSSRGPTAGRGSRGAGATAGSAPPRAGSRARTRSSDPAPLDGGGGGGGGGGVARRGRGGAEDADVGGAGGAAPTCDARANAAEKRRARCVAAPGQPPTSTTSSSTSGGGVASGPHRRDAIAARIARG